MKKNLALIILISLAALAVGGSIYLHGTISTVFTMAIGAIFFPVLIFIGKSKA